MEDVPALIGVLADALGDAIEVVDQASSDARVRTSLLDTLRTWLRPKLAPVTDLRIVRESSVRRDVS